MKYTIPRPSNLGVNANPQDIEDFNNGIRGALVSPLIGEPRSIPLIDETAKGNERNKEMVPVRAIMFHTEGNDLSVVNFQIEGAIIKRGTKLGQGMVKPIRGVVNLHDYTVIIPD